MAMTDGQYTQHMGESCPYCESNEVHATERAVHIALGIGSQEMSCPKCREVWTEHYRLVGYIDTDWKRRAEDIKREPLIASRLFDGSINIAMLKDSDETFMLSWDDGVANDNVESYPTLSAMLARAAVLAACMETKWDNGFIEGPEIFAGHALIFTKSRIG